MQKESCVAHSRPSGFSPAQAYEFCAAFGRQGGDPDLLQELIENKERMSRVVEIARSNDIPHGYKLATMALGNDFITPEEVARAYGFSYTDKQLKHFVDSLPDLRTILELSINGYVLMAGPPRDLSLLKVREFNNTLFSKGIQGWHTEVTQKFAQSDTVKAGEWIAVRKEVYPDSFTKPWDEQQELLSKNEYVPNAPTIGYAVTVYVKVRGICILNGQYARTSSVANPHGCHVIVAAFQDGIIVNLYGNDVCCSNIGVACARKI